MPTPQAGHVSAAPISFPSLLGSQGLCEQVAKLSVGWASGGLGPLWGLPPGPEAPGNFSQAPLGTPMFVPLQGATPFLGCLSNVFWV